MSDLSFVPCLRQCVERDMHTVQHIERKQLIALLDAVEERDQLRVQLSAWAEVFGTSALSHAAARLEAAERLKVAERWQERLQKRIAELEAQNRDLREQIAEITTGEKGGAR